MDAAGPNPAQPINEQAPISSSAGTVWSRTIRPSGSRRKRPARVPIHNVPSGPSASARTCPNGMVEGSGSTRRKRGSSRGRSRTNSPPAVPIHIRPPRSIFKVNDLIGCRVGAQRIHRERNRPRVLTRSVAGVRCNRLDRTRTSGIGSQSGQPTPGSDPVHARSGLHDRVHLRMRKPLLRPVVDEPAAIEPAQSVGGAKPEKTQRISKHTADAIVGESIGSVVDVEGDTLGLQDS